MQMQIRTQMDTTRTPGKKNTHVRPPKYIRRPFTCRNVPCRSLVCRCAEKGYAMCRAITRPGPYGLLGRVLISALRAQTRRGSNGVGVGGWVVWTIFSEQSERRCHCQHSSIVVYVQFNIRAAWIMLTILQLRLSLQKRVRVHACRLCACALLT